MAWADRLPDWHTHHHLAVPGQLPHPGGQLIDRNVTGPWRSASGPLPTFPDIDEQRTLCHQLSGRGRIHLAEPPGQQTHRSLLSRNQIPLGV